MTIVGDLPSIAEFLDELPLIDEFLDRSPDLPAVNEYTVGETSSVSAYNPPAPGDEANADSWAPGDWQGYNWGRHAGLGGQPSDESRAAAEWSNTDWGKADNPYKQGSARKSRPMPQRGGNRAAGEIAAALNTLAARIRSGELPVSDLPASQPEAVLAAALAALLRQRS